MITKKMLWGILVLSLVITACSTPKTETPTNTEPTVNQENTQVPTTSPDLDEDIQDLGKSEDELDISDLEGIEQDLA